MAMLERMLEPFAEPLQRVITIAASLLGAVFGVALYALVAVHTYAFFSCVVPALRKRMGKALTIAWCAVGLTILYNLCFNHFFAMVTRPGSPKALLKDEEIRRQMKNRDHRSAVKVNLKRDAGQDGSKESALDVKEDDRFVGLSKDVKRLMKYRTKTVANLRALWTRRCEKCNDIKPARTHHCSACGQCVFHMDHHCRKY